MPKTFVISESQALVFYNRAAEPLIGLPFAELGQVDLRGERYRAFQVTDEDGSPIEGEDHPLSPSRTKTAETSARSASSGR